MNQQLTVQLPKMDGYVINESVQLIGEPTPIPDTNRMRCLANVEGCMCLIEISVKFAQETQ